MKKKLQTEAEKTDVMARALERVSREEARQNRTGKRRPIPWIFVDIDAGDVLDGRDVSPLPRIVK